MNTDTDFFEALRGEIDEATNDNGAATFDYTIPKQNKAARSHVHRLRSLKASIEKRRKEVKRGADSVAKELTAGIEAMITPHATAIKEVEEAEARRIAWHKARLARFENATRASDDEGQLHGSNYLTDMLERVRSLEVDEAWQEFQETATKAQADAIATLERLVAEAQQREQDAADLARLREKEAAEQAAREAEESRKRAEAEAKAKADRAAAERAAQAAPVVTDPEPEPEPEAPTAPADVAPVVESAPAAHVATETVAHTAPTVDVNDYADSMTKIRNEIAAALQDQAELSTVDAELVADLLCADMVPHVSVNFGG